MKKQELRECFDRIRPREALVEATLARMNEQRGAGRLAARRGLTVGFATKLASAACALLLVLGVGIAVIRGNSEPGAVAPREGEDSVSLTADGQGESTDTAPESGEVARTEEQMVATAKGYGTDWAVASVGIVAIGNGEVTMSPVVTKDSSVELGDEIVAQMSDADTQWQPLADAMGGMVLVGLHTEVRDGETVWILHEIGAAEAQ